jgi:hypothetical protein
VIPVKIASATSTPGTKISDEGAGAEPAATAGVRAGMEQPPLVSPGLLMEMMLKPAAPSDKAGQNLPRAYGVLWFDLRGVDRARLSLEEKVTRARRQVFETERARTAFCAKLHALLGAENVLIHEWESWDTDAPSLEDDRQLELPLPRRRRRPSRRK